MSRKTLIALALTLAATANAAPLPLADNIPASKDDVMTYIGKESKTTAPLVLTLDPEGGETVATIPQGGKATVLLHDGKGHTLVTNHFGLTGWAQPASSAENNDDFPALEKSKIQDKDDRLMYIYLRYLPALGKATQGEYYLGDDDTLRQPPPPASKPGEASPFYIYYDHLLETALKAGGDTYHVDCQKYNNDGLESYCRFLPGGKQDKNAASLAGRDYYIPGNGYVYTDYDDSGSSHYRKRQKWELDGKDFKEIKQPYHYLGINSAYEGMNQSTADELDKKATLTLTDASGQKVATLKAGEKITVVLADARYDCPANARIGDKDDPICNETRLLVKTADGTLGWLIVDFGGDNYPSIDGLHPLAG